MKNKLIHTPNYLLVVDDSEIKEGDFVLVSCSELEVIETLKVKGYYNEQFLFDDGSQIHMDYCKKIISHLPLNDSPILEWVDLLPPLEQEDDVEKLAEEYGENIGNKNGTAAFDYKRGYNKAKEKYNYTEEDMKYMFECGRNYQNNAEITFKVAMEYLSQPKMPVWIKCEIQQLGSQTEGYYEVPITTTNSQGQIVWVGKYIY